MTFTLFLQICIPAGIFFIGLLTTLFINNNKSHKEVWIQINQNNIDITNRLTRIETKLENLKNGRKCD